MKRMTDMDETQGQSSPAATAAPLQLVNTGLRTLVRQILAILGLVFIIIGVPLAIITPFPFVPIGLPVVIFGVVLLGRNSVWGRQWMERVLERHPTVERFAPDWLMKLVFGRDKAHLHDD
ncbi:MAG: hypothetical protein AAGJ32_00350 [Pseudomonadota bacterium]